MPRVGKRVLVACEFSGVVRDAFLERGHDAYSCDILRSFSKRSPERHFQQDVTELLREPWDLVIAHPPCTYLTNTGVRWFKDDPVGRMLKLLSACDFFMACLNANAPMVCVENPIMHRYAKERIKEKATQIIQPWMFGHGDTKATCLWLRGLPELKPTNIVPGRRARSHMMSTSPFKSMKRSVTYRGIAEAMADQWGSL